MSSVTLVSAGHAVGGWNFHLQFTPAYRRRIFEDDELKKACERVAREVAARLKIEVAASEFGPDHWHLFVTNCKNYSAPKLVQYFKGNTSRVLRRDYNDRVKKMLWGDHFWSHGYFAETIGRVTGDTVNYIERQQKKHWNTKPQKPNTQKTLQEYSVN